jgi:hypothetical protein
MTPRWAAAVVVAAVLVPAAAAAQTTTVAPTAPATPPPTATVPSATASPTVPAPTTTLPAPGTTIAGGCPAFPPPDVVFTGDVVAKGERLVTFRVTELAVGALPGERVAVAFPDDARFLRLGQRYRVAALRDAESETLSSKVRRPPDEQLSEECTAADEVVTVNSDGTTVDTGLLAGMRGKWGRALFLVLAPLAVAIVALLALVIVKRILVFGWRLPQRLRDVRARRRPPPPAAAGHAGGVPPVSRR